MLATKGAHVASAPGKPLLLETRTFTPEEVEEIFAGVHKIRRSRQKLYSALGEILDGRLGFVVFRRLPEGRMRVVTARDMNKSENQCFAVNR